MATPKADRRPWLVAAAVVMTLVATLPARAQSLSGGERSQLIQALDAARNEAWDRAALLARDLPAPLPTAIEWRRLLRQDPPPSFDELASFRLSRPDWPGERTLAARTEKAALDAPTSTVSAYFQRFQPVTAHGHWAYARVLSAAGSADAAAQARAAWRDSSAFTAGEESRFLGEFGNVLTLDDHRARLDDLAWRGQTSAAERGLDYVDSDYRKLIAARLAVRTDRPGLDARVAAVPPALQADAGLLYERARYRRRAGNEAGAAEILLTPTRDVGGGSRWWDERRYAYREAILDGNMRLAYRLAAGHGQPDGSGYADSEWHAGWLALRYLDRPADALAHFERMDRAVDTPISKGRAAYWAGRAAEAMGRIDEARAWYERAAAFGITFYGQEAAARLSRAPVIDRVLPTSDLASYRTRELPRLALLLGQVDDTLILPWVTRDLVQDGESVAEIANGIAIAQEVGRYDSAIGGYIPLYRAGAVSAGASHPVPTRFPGLLRPADASVSPALALAIARQESRFNPAAVSRAGARGLMQLMPATAQQVARKAGLPQDVGRLTRDPDFNASLGNRYLGDLVRRFGDTSLAAAGYNAGPGRPAQWIERFGDPRRMDRFDYIDWLERIPFSETRNYVQRVIEGQRVYDYVLAGG
ncbi:MAG: lytic transglycosylase domain-containing protein [Pseudomonadota bacterium]